MANILIDIKLFIRFDQPFDLAGYRQSWMATFVIGVKQSIEFARRALAAVGHMANAPSAVNSCGIRLSTRLRRRQEMGFEFDIMDQAVTALG